MARESSAPRNARDSQPTTSSPPATEDDAVGPVRDVAVDEFWSSVRVDPVEIALPRDTGFTLRAYRPADQVTPTDVSDREEELFPERRHANRFVLDEKALDDEDDESELPDADTAWADEDDDRAGADQPDEDAEAADDTDAEGDAGKDDDAGEDDDSDEEPDTDEQAGTDVPVEEVPVFLGHRGRLLLFRSEQGLVDFVRSGAEHDLGQLDTWSELAEKLTAEHVVPAEDDRYELDLVVENLRGGRDGWDPDLVIRAGEVARDLGYALRLEPVLTALAPGSPLDDLDDTLRATAAGGVGGFLARRRLRKIGAEAAPLGWRTIIGKISAAVDWRD